VTQYPHELSGGMRQRVMIAMALACGPRLLIADEPTTALDVTIQAQILNLMLALKEKTGAAIVLITHDLGVVAEMAQRVVVMYAGRKVEEAPVAALFERPLHPYTLGLLNSIPRLDHAHVGHRARLAEIPGSVPSLREEPVGCTFAPRCAFSTDVCRAEYPPLEMKAEGHYAACWHSDRLAPQGGAPVNETEGNPRFPSVTSFPSATAAALPPEGKGRGLDGVRLAFPGAAPDRP
jgi:peptide/nickel transport system ATP-binding protein